MAIVKVPIFDDRIKISSTDKSFGNCLISDILCLEQFIERGISLITVCGVTILFSSAKAIVKVLKIDPYNQPAVELIKKETKKNLIKTCVTI